MNLTQSEIDRLVYMSRIAPYTTDNNRTFHHAMLDAGWIPVVGTVGIREWQNKSGHSQLTYEATQDFFEANGCIPVPF